MHEKSLIQDIPRPNHLQIDRLFISSHGMHFINNIILRLSLLLCVRDKGRRGNKITALVTTTPLPG